MSIVRGPRPTQNFYLLDKRISDDKNLSWAARGMLIFLLGKPDNWTISIQALVNETEISSMHSGRDGVYRILKELKEVGYIVSAQSQGEAGTFSTFDYIVSETPDKPLTALPLTALPLTALPLTALPLTALPLTANPRLVSTEKAVSIEKAVSTERRSPKLSRKTCLPENFEASQHVLAWAKSKGFGDLDRHLEFFVDSAKARGYMYVDWDAAFMNCIRKDWAGLNAKAASPFLPRDDWYKSDAGTDRKGREIGLAPKGGESYSAYRDRIFEGLRKQARGA